MINAWTAFRHRHRRRLRTHALLGAAITVGALAAVPASADESGALTPFVSCISTDSTTGEITAYFGYENTLGSQKILPVGDNNQLFPTSPNAGQPTTYETGVYPRVFSVAFDPVIFPSIAWILNGQEADASTASPACTSAVSAPATVVTASGATLTGVVVPEGADTTYSFEYGTTTALGTTTVSQDFGSGTQPGLVQAALTGLAPHTQYYYRIDASDGYVTTKGDTLTFTTGTSGSTTPPPPHGTPLALTTSHLPSAREGSAYKAQFSATGGTKPYKWSIAHGSLPRGLRLNSATGTVSGTPQCNGTSSFTVRLTDATRPAAKSVTHQFSLAVDKRKSGHGR